MEVGEAVPATMQLWRDAGVTFSQENVRTGRCVCNTLSLSLSLTHTHQHTHKHTPTPTHTHTHTHTHTILHARPHSTSKQGSPAFMQLQIRLQRTPRMPLIIEVLSLHTHTHTFRMHCPNYYAIFFIYLSFPPLFFKML
jgi:hypothetical protein